MAKVAINLNERVPREEDGVGIPAEALTPGSSDPSPAAGAVSDRAFDASAEPTPAPSNSSSNKACKCEESGNTVAVIAPLVVNGSPAPVDSIQKKIRRAERFGVPVQLSEAEKRNSRAERFGTGSGMKKPKSLNTSEELKRKARAERFGVSMPEVMNEEEKKKARLERFASNAKTVSNEEEKRKARTIRFSNVSVPVSQVNNKAAVAGGTSLRA